MERFCIQCGRSFAASADEDRCSDCAGPGEVLVSAPETVIAGSVVDAPVSGAGRSFPTVESVPVGWEPTLGDVVLDLYEVRGIVGEGGMGTVYRVHHRGWGLDLAVKSPKPDMQDQVDGIVSFTTEAEAWVNLGLHPHIVTCHYVRTLGGVPRVFAELVEGGSLTDCIEAGRLYQGGPAEALARILDVAIQFAWGLGYAHERGLVHQDVKPANVLLTVDGVVKVTDFGLAHAENRPIEPGDDDGVRSLLVDTGSYTPAYASPEQVKGDALSRRTDVWSWGLSVLEMFTGGRTWGYGQAAPHVLTQYLADGPVRDGLPIMPEGVVGLLGECFELNPDDRPHDFDLVVQRLHSIHEDVTGRTYSRQRPTPAELRPDGHNNRALSFLDLGKDDQAAAAWEEALQLDPLHADSAYNYGLHLWRRAKITDRQLVQRLNPVAVALDTAWQPHHMLALVHIERGDGSAALAALDEAEKRTSPTPAIQEARQAAASLLHQIVAEPILGQKRVRALALTPNGAVALVASGTKIQVWDLFAGSCIGTLTGHTDPIRAVTTTSDGSRAVSGAGKEIRIWDLSTFACLRKLSSRTGRVMGLAVPGDGRTVIGALSNGIRIWDADTGRTIRRLKVANGTRTVAATEDGQWVVAGCGGHIEMWNLTRGEQHASLRYRAGALKLVHAVAVTPDGRHAVSEHGDHLVVWDLARGESIRSLSGHTGKVSGVDLIGAGDRILSAAADGTVRIWNLQSGSCLRTIEGHTRGVVAIAVSADGQYGLTAGKDSAVRVHGLSGIAERRAPWRVSQPSPVSETISNEAAVRSLLADADRALESGQPARAGELIGQVRRTRGYEHDPRADALMQDAGCRGGVRAGLLYGRSDVLSIERRGSGSVAFVPGDRRVVTARGSSVFVFDPARPDDASRLSGHRNLVNSVAVTSNARTLVSGGEDETLRVWDLATGRCVGLLEGHARHVECVAVTPDGRRVVSGSKDKTVRIWDLTSGDSLCVLEGHKRSVNCVAVSPDGMFAVSGSDDGTVRIWDLAGGAETSSLGTGELGVNAVALTAAGDQVVAGCGSRVDVWDWATGRHLRTLTGHTRYVSAVLVTPDSRYVVSASWDSTLRVWDLATGDCVSVLRGHSDHVAAAALSGDGRFALSSGRDHTLRWWDLGWEYEFPDPVDWDDGARPFLEIFLTLRTPYGPDGLSREGHPSWSDGDFEQLLTELGWRGFGWLRPEGVRAELEEMAVERGWRREA